MPEQNQEITITLPDGSTKQCPKGLSVMDIAQSIGAGLANSTIAGEVNGKLVDACDPVNQDANIRIITSRDAEGVDIIRHSCAHLVGMRLNNFTQRLGWSSAR